MLNLLVFPASIYLLVVAVCVANRMTYRTSHLKRFGIAMMGGLAMWSLARSVQLDWIIAPANCFMALLVIGLSVVMAIKFRRIST